MSTPTRAAIYLDVNGGAMIHPEVTHSLLSLLQDQEIGLELGHGLGANPSSIHAQGRHAKKLLIQARDQVAHSLGLADSKSTRPTEKSSLTFTSSGTEANQLAIRSVLETLLDSVNSNESPQELPENLREESYVSYPPHWITTPVEHSCVIEMIEWFKSRGGEVSLLPVDSEGAPVVSSLKELLRPETALVSCIWVNNETGVISDVESLALQCKEAGIPLHIDAAQAWGKLPVDLSQLETMGVTYAAFAGHKIGALAGIGVLFSAAKARIHSPIRGKQENGRRGGTENLLSIISLGAAAMVISRSLEEGRFQNDQNRLAGLRNRLQNWIVQNIPGTILNGAQAQRIAGTLNFCFEGIEREGLVQALDLDGFAVSSGSACSSGTVEPSHVLLAMGRGAGLSQAAVRVSIPSGVYWDSLLEFGQSLEKIVARMRGKSSAEFRNQLSGD